MIYNLHIDDIGLVKVEDFTNFFDLSRSPYVGEIFFLFDLDGDEKLNFEEFVVSLCNYCSMEQTELSLLSFHLLDKNCSGELSEKEIISLLEIVYGRRKTNQLRMQYLMDAATDKRKGANTIQLNEFLALNRKSPLLMYPSMHIHTVLREKTLGGLAWDRVQESRRIKGEVKVDGVAACIEKLQARQERIRASFNGWKKMEDECAEGGERRKSSVNSVSKVQMNMQLEGLAKERRRSSASSASSSSSLNSAPQENASVSRRRSSSVAPMPDLLAEQTAGERRKSSVSSVASNEAEIDDASGVCAEGKRRNSSTTSTEIKTVTMGTAGPKRNYSVAPNYKEVYNKSLEKEEEQQKTSHKRGSRRTSSVAPSKT